MTNKELNYIARIFTSSFLNIVLQDKHKQTITSSFTKAGIRSQLSNKAVSSVLDQAFGILSDRYRCEYVYKTAIANQILMGKHSVDDSLMLTEFRAGKSKADVVVINGTSTVYEIKTELDNLDRLTGQTEEYLQIFDIVNILTYSENVDRVKSCVGKRVGILVLSEKGEIKEHRRPVSNKKSINVNLLFDSLRRVEYEHVVKAHYGYVPQVPNTIIYTACKELFSKIPPARAHDYATKAILKSRSLKPTQKQLVKDAPESMRMLLLSREFNADVCQHIHTAINSRFA